MSLNHPHESGDESSACVWDYCEVLLRWDDIELDFDCGPAFETLQYVLVLFHYCSVQGNPTLPKAIITDRIRLQSYPLQSMNSSNRLLL